MSELKAVFFGSPAFAVPCLNALVDVAEVCAVISQPDKPAGRGMSLRAPAVAKRGKELKLPVFQPTKIRSREFAEQLAAFGADVAVVVAYGRILPETVLSVPRLGCVNVHASLLPRWRGAAPIQWAIASGDKKTGVCLMLLDEGMDTGPVLACAETEIERDENAAELSDRLSALGASLLRQELPRFVAGDLKPIPQDEKNATHARLLVKADGIIDWQLPAQQVHDRIRGMNPWPGATTRSGEIGFKIHRSRILKLTGIHGQPGQIIQMQHDAIEVACGDGTVGITEIQESGRKKLSVAEYCLGRPLLGHVLGP